MTTVMLTVLIGGKTGIVERFMDHNSKETTSADLLQRLLVKNGVVVIPPNLNLIYGWIQSMSNLE